MATTPATQATTQAAATAQAGGGRTWTIALPPGITLLSANDRLHWGKRAAITKAIRETAGWLARTAGIPRLDRVDVTAAYRPPDRRKRDTHNLAPSVKAAIDGLVDAGVLADDNDLHVASVTFIRGPVLRRGQLLLHIQECNRADKP